MIATLTYKAVISKHLGLLLNIQNLSPMHVNTGHIYQLLLQHLSVGGNSYGDRALSYVTPTVWNNSGFRICQPLLGSGAPNWVHEIKAYKINHLLFYYKLSFHIRNASSVSLFRKKLKTRYFKVPSRRPNGCVMSGSEIR